ncbi:MAG: ABC transporter permease [Hyphomicrobiaceae bacterium]|nr:ABC transporter permease [Hyphomicrobiaceae bacterium]
MADGSADFGQTPPLTPRREKGFTDRLGIQMRVIHALMLREMMTRFGRQNLGFFWLMGEPLILSLMVMIGWTIAKGTHDHNIGVIPFVLTGYSMITMWRHIMSRSVHCLSHNAGLMFHRNVHLMDALTARGLLEIGGCALSFAIAYVPLYLFELVPPIDDPLLLVTGWVLTGWFCLSFAMCIAALSERYEIVERFVQPLMYITLPVTGTFYMVDWMPANIQPWLLWSPMVHGNEMFRAGLFGPQVVAHYDPAYLALCCLVLTTAGIAMVRWVRKYVRLDR